MYVLTIVPKNMGSGHFHNICLWTRHLYLGHIASFSDPVWPGYCLRTRDLAAHVDKHSVISSFQCCLILEFMRCGMEKYVDAVESFDDTSDL